jgi:AraC family transcriptional regulator
MPVASLPTFSTYGRPIAQRDFGGFALSVGHHHARETIPAHRHADEYQWCVTLDGEFEEKSGSQHEECGMGSLLVRPSDCIHANRFSAARGLCLSLFPRRAWLSQNGFTSLMDTYCHQRSTRLLSLGRELAHELQHPDPSGAIAAEALLIELLESASRLSLLRSEGHPTWLASALDQIESVPGDELRLSSLAGHARVSAGHLARAFRSAFGMSVGGYIRERRLQRAATLIRTSNSKLADIAAVVGFCDQAHFSRVFKARFGATPAAYRNEVRS